MKKMTIVSNSQSNPQNDFYAYAKAHYHEMRVDYERMSKVPLLVIDEGQTLHVYPSHETQDPFKKSYGKNNSLPSSESP